MTIVLTYLPYIQTILAVLLTASILVQQSEASAGGAFGGNDNWNAGYHTRRGFEKFIFNTTIILGILFILTALVAIIIR
jgi:protein translocase SecG subunit